MKDLIALLKGNQAISGYRVASVARKTYELFFYIASWRPCAPPTPWIRT